MTQRPGIQSRAGGHGIVVAFLVEQQSRRVAPVKPEYLASACGPTAVADDTAVVMFLGASTALQAYYETEAPRDVGVYLHRQVPTGRVLCECCVRRGLVE